MNFEYMKGFVDCCIARGVDPVALAKQAQAGMGQYYIPEEYFRPSRRRRSGGVPWGSIAGWGSLAALAILGVMYKMRGGTFGMLPKRLAGFTQAWKSLPEGTPIGERWRTSWPILDPAQFKEPEAFDPKTGPLTAVGQGAVTPDAMRQNAQDLLAGGGTTPPVSVDPTKIKTK